MSRNKPRKDRARAHWSQPVPLRTPDDDERQRQIQEGRRLMVVDEESTFTKEQFDALKDRAARRRA